ncbi:oxidoreductase [Patescibacteria group bacterium]|nr:oxidoreductase [Patescibacteria group bacterium]
MEFLDRYLNRITMYRLTLYYLIGLLAIAIGGSAAGFLPYNPLDIAIGALLAVIVSVPVNMVFARLFGAVTNTESVFITALILSLIVPFGYPEHAGFLVSSCIFAMAVKYLPTIDKHHIFNPAGASVAALALLTGKAATWWVGTPFLAPFVLLGGYLLVRKIERERMVAVYALVYLIAVALASLLRTGSLLTVFTTWQTTILRSAFLFLGLVMLTEPLTSPTTARHRDIYAGVVALLAATPVLRIGIALTPELALSVGNILSYVMSPNYRLDLAVAVRKLLTPDTLAMSFAKPPGFRYEPGQYMEWTLPHWRPDSRGVRRYFSLASSPTEGDLAIGVKFYTPPSTYKRTLAGLLPGAHIIAAQVAGDFVLPKDPSIPLVFVAGGIGVVPFRSMIKYLVDRRERRDIVLLYANRKHTDIAYRDIFDAGSSVGIRTVYTLTDTASIPADWKGERGRVTPEMVKRAVPDWQRRTYYLSGPQLMVENFEHTLSSMGVPKLQVKTDFFPGYSET